MYVPFGQSTLFKCFLAKDRGIVRQRAAMTSPKNFLKKILVLYRY